MQQQQQQQQQDFFHQMLDNLYDGVYFVDNDRIITYWNKGAERLSGFTAEEVVGRGCRDNILVHVDACGKGLCQDGCPLTAAMADGSERRADLFMHHRDGHRVPVDVRATPIQDAQGRVTGVVEIFSDNTTHTADQQRIAQLKQLAYFDPLTEIANRRFLETALQGRLDEQSRYGWGFGVIFLDVDHFKNFNDTHGHDLGDQVLQMVAKTLSTCSRSFDTVGRWGGEEFVVVVANVDLEQLTVIAERYRQMIQHSSLSHEGQRLEVTVSLGAALGRADDTAESVLSRADALMYDSKVAGRNRVTTAA